MGREGAGSSVDIELPNGGNGREGEGGGTADNQNTRNHVRTRRKNKTLKCITLNAQSLVSKMPEFKVIVRDKRPHIISVTESWGQEWQNDSIFSIEGYTMYRNDRHRIRGGGTILYISNNIEQRVCRPLNV